MTLGEEEVQGRQKQKIPESYFKPSESMQREREMWRRKLVIHQQRFSSGWEWKVRAFVVSVVGNRFGLHDLSFLSMVSYDFSILTKHHGFQTRIKKHRCRGVLARAQKVGKQRGKDGIML